MKKLAIITTHPIQYNAPLFRLMTERKKIDLRVFYTLGKAGAENNFDHGFGKVIRWDIPLLQGYSFEFMANSAPRPGYDHFRGIINYSLRDAIMEWKPDALLVYGWNYQSHLKIMRYFKDKIPVWFRGDSTLQDDSGKSFTKRTARRVFLNWVYRHVDRALYTGKNNKAYFMRCGVPASKLLFVPHVVDNERFSDTDGRYEKEAMEIRGKLGIGKEELVFLFAGKLEPKKDPELLLECFMQLPQRHCRLLLVGNGILEQALKEKAAPDKRVHFLDFQNQSLMPAIYRTGDIFVLPSRGPGETWGLAVNEAMACGLPVLVSDKCGCAADLVADGKNGFIFEAGSREDLAKKMNFMLVQEKELKNFGKCSEGMIAEWSMKKAACIIENTLAETN